MNTANAVEASASMLEELTAVYQLDASVELGRIALRTAGWSHEQLRQLCRYAELIAATRKPVKWEVLQDLVRGFFARWRTTKASLEAVRLDGLDFNLAYVACTEA